MTGGARSGAISNRNVVVAHREINCIPAQSSHTHSYLRALSRQYCEALPRASSVLPAATYAAKSIKRIAVSVQFVPAIRKLGIDLAA
eukprot:1202211-Rhodomonas_salina.2